MRTLALLVALLGCERGIPDDDRLAREGAEQAAAVTFTYPPPPRPPPPPPPPPPMPAILPPPVEILAFVRDHANDEEPWQVTLYELPDGEPRPPLFMGAHVRHRRVLGRGASVQLVAKLLQPIYTDGDTGGWLSTSLGIRVACGSATLDLVYNAGHLFLTPAWHDGRFVVVTDALWFEALRERMAVTRPRERARL